MTRTARARLAAPIPLALAIAHNGGAALPLLALVTLPYTLTLRQETAWPLPRPPVCSDPGG